jgi:ferric-dicitrate binding protein FerR (iron transport regulator)
VAEHDEDDVPAGGPDYLWDHSGPPDPDIARLEALLSPMAHDAPLKLPADVVPITRAPRRRLRWAIAGGALAAAAAAVILFVVIRRQGPAGCDRPSAGFAFSADAAVKCNGGAGARGTLAVGGWIETDAGTARVEVASIGTVELQPGSRLALRGTSPTEHRLALERGALHAKVIAPPRLFVVETPSATAIDLGCEYDLAVGEDGHGTLTVTTGQVELAAPGGGIVVVPAGTMATFAPDGVGLPIRTGANQLIRDAAALFDPARPETVNAILMAAGDGDQITLLNLLVLAGPYQRQAIFDALHALAPAPEDVLQDAVIAGDEETLARWRNSVVDGWMLSEWCVAPGPDKVDPHGPHATDPDATPAPDASPWKGVRPDAAESSSPIDPPADAATTWDPPPGDAATTWGP